MKSILCCRFLAIGIVVFAALAGLGSEATAACSGSGLTWTCTGTNNTSLANIQSAYNSGTDGMTITLDAGTYTWTSGTLAMTSTKGATIRCATLNGCVATMTGLRITITTSGTNTKTYRITRMRFEGSNSTGGGGCACNIWIDGSGVISGFRFDHNIVNGYGDTSFLFTGSTSSNITVNGVVDHNTFSGTTNYQVIKVLGRGSPNNWASTARGSVNNFFLEDNVITFSTIVNLGQGCIDAWNGAAVVARFNDSTNCLWTAHGVTHDNTVNFEFYGNRVRRTAGSGGIWEDCTRCFHHQGSNEIYVWRNRFFPIGTISGPIGVTHYRSGTQADAGYSWTTQCTGTNTTYDGNTSPTTTYRGWPCWNQPGRAPAGGSPIYGTLAPMYAWGNVDNSTSAKVDLEIEDPFTATPHYIPEHLVANRDYYNAVNVNANTSKTSPFNGTTGMGYGPIANRPDNCTHTTAPNGEEGGGVGYFATDVGTWKLATPTQGETTAENGVLYRCSATNTWTPHYTPYQYPHQLVCSQDGGCTAATAPAAPTNVRVASITNEASAR